MRSYTEEDYISLMVCDLYFYKVFNPRAPKSQPGGIYGKPKDGGELMCLENNYKSIEITNIF